MKTDHHRRAEPHQPRYYKTHLFWVALLTGVVLGTLGFHWYIGARLSRVAAPLAHASIDIQYQIASFHLALEESLQDSASTPPEQAWSYLHNALWHIQAMLEGGTNEDGTYHPITDPPTRLLLLNTLQNMQQLSNLAKSRVMGHDVMGSPIDRTFNQLYGQTIQATGQVRQAIMQEIGRQEQQYQTVGLGFGGLLLLLALGTWLVLNEKEWHRRQFERRNARLARIIEQSVNEIYFFEAGSFRITMANGSICHNLCYREEELLALTPLDIMPEHAPASFRAWLQPLLDHSQPFIQCETVHRRKDGSRYEASIRLQYMDDPQDAPLFVAFVRDITRQKQVNQSLLLRETAMQAAANTIVITNRDGNIEWANPAFTHSTGYALDEAIGRNPRILKSGRQDATFYQQLWDTILAGQTWQGVFINKCKDGQLVHEEATITPVRDETGQIRHFVAVKQDVTKRVMAEQALQEAKQRAEAASQAKSDFLATMSHEIRTPLNAVLGVLELLKESDLAPDQREQVQLAAGSGKLLLHLINDILDYSRIEAGQLVLDCIPFNLRTLLDEIALNMSPLAHAKQVDLTPFFPQELPASVCGDPHRLSQIFTNLIGNAIKFTPVGGVVEFHGGPVGRKGEWVEFLFEIRDTGIGIPAAERDHLFDRFVQANTSSTRQHGGTGLGLAICQRLVRLMGGDIGIDDNPFAASGSIFHFTVQLLEQALPGVDPQPDVLAGLRVLIVGSQGLQQAMLHNALHAWGVHYTDCDHLPAALAILEHGATRQEPCQVVIVNQWLDPQRPRALPESYQARACFLLLIDRLDQGADQVVALPGDTVCLKKPFSTNQLHTALCTLLQLDDGSPPPPVVPPSDTPLFRTATVLIVDDQVTNLTIALGMLVRLGCDPDRCATAMNGQQAVALFQQRRFDIVFMDCQMPVMDGYQATRLIREWEQPRGETAVPIIAFTADVTQANRLAGEAAGMNGFVTKPVSMKEFRRVLAQHLAVPEPVTVVGAGAAPPTPQAPNVRSVGMALQSIGFEGEEGRQVVQVILEQLPALLNKLERELQAMHHEQVRAISHVLCGSMIHILFPDLQQETRSLHEAVRQQDWQEVHQHLARVRNAFAPIQAALQAWMEQAAQV
ncbi:MAG: PAS domain S-box protein [Magnetococcus sp. DMHC-8]